MAMMWSGSGLLNCVSELCMIFVQVGSLKFEFHFIHRTEIYACTHNIACICNTHTEKYGKEKALNCSEQLQKKNAEKLSSVYTFLKSLLPRDPGFHHYSLSISVAFYF